MYLINNDMNFILMHDNSRNNLVKFVTLRELWLKKLCYIEGTKIHLIFCYITKFSRERQFYSLYRDFCYIELCYIAR